MWVILAGGGLSGQTPVREEAGFHKWKKLNRSHGVTGAGMTFRVVWNWNKEALYSSINSLTMGYPQRASPPFDRRQCPAMSHQQPTLPANRGMKTLVPEGCLMVSHSLPCKNEIQTPRCDPGNPHDLGPANPCLIYAILPLSLCAPTLLEHKCSAPTSKTLHSIFLLL